jgi:hypothetical protein
VRRVPLDISEADYEARLAVSDAERRTVWSRMPSAERRSYIRRMQNNGGDPPELLELLSDSENREAWGYVPWIVQREYCLWINEGTWLARRKRARIALRDGPSESLLTR